MRKWIDYMVVALALIVMVITCVGMYSTWRDCTTSGGTTVRGLFGLECMRR